MVNKECYYFAKTPFWSNPNNNDYPNLKYFDSFISHDGMEPFEGNINFIDERTITITLPNDGRNLYGYFEYTNPVTKFKSYYFATNIEKQLANAVVMRLQLDLYGTYIIKFFRFYANNNELWILRYSPKWNPNVNKVQDPYLASLPFQGTYEYVWQRDGFITDANKQDGDYYAFNVNWGKCTLHNNGYLTEIDYHPTLWRKIDTHQPVYTKPGITYYVFDGTPNYGEYHDYILVPVLEDEYYVKKGSSYFTVWNNKNNIDKAINKASPNSPFALAHFRGRLIGPPFNIALKQYGKKIYEMWYSGNADFIPLEINNSSLNTTDDDIIIMFHTIEGTFQLYNDQTYKDFFLWSSPPIYFHTSPDYIAWNFYQYNPVRYLDNELDIGLFSSQGKYVSINTGINVTTMFNGNIMGSYENIYEPTTLNTLKYGYYLPTSADEFIKYRNQTINSLNTGFLTNTLGQIGNGLMSYGGGLDAGFRGMMRSIFNITTNKLNIEAKYSDVRNNTGIKMNTGMENDILNFINYVYGFNVDTGNASYRKNQFYSCTRFLVPRPNSAYNTLFWRHIYLNGWMVNNYAKIGDYVNYNTPFLWVFDERQMEETWNQKNLSLDIKNEILDMMTNTGIRTWGDNPSNMITYDKNNRWEGDKWE